ncbi:MULTISPECIES: AraC family transcriptional regulator [unclassified Flavobacterium]|uniref:helix-turn-helix domain-containing protein n=1 Tax=unclassified Flavobacterium TaxID=196869 RepID=UPI001F142ABA|nr:MULTISPECIES: AraC family transcriptional regulator [unclassified Flavobacterium]UMY65147.1 AraC family transcriptional regulator [Flavobacterium sp. HJ-32-4]HLN96377.1 AraC family transcriptional regulator [Flavobacterium sp.]
MKLQIKYDINKACKMILQEQMNRLDIPYEVTGLGEIEINRNVSAETYKELQQALDRYGIEIIENPKNAFIQRIKDTIVEMIYNDEKQHNTKVSVYLSDKLNHSYGYLSSLFSEVTHTSIENFIILQKIERAKQMIIEDKLTLTEMAWQLNYSSVAHLSNQFKKTTGLTPTAFQRIIKKRKSVRFATDEKS